MSYPITVNYIPGLPAIPFRNGVGHYEGVVAHATDTYNDTAAAERNYESGHFNNAFVHFFVDSNSIVQCANTDYEAWGAGPVANGRFIHVELCQTHDAGLFLEAYKRYVWLLAKLLKDKNLGVVRRSTLWTHHDVTSVLGGTTHTDPDAYLAEHGVTIDKLVADVLAEYNGPAPVASNGYTVQNGDTLWGIATKNHLTVAQLKSLNGLTSDVIKPGQVLVVSGAAPAQPVASAPSLKVNYTRVMQLGSVGNDVKQLQAALNAVYFKCGTPDGQFGPATQDAVKRFQSVYFPYGVDGIAGPSTVTKLNSMVK